MLAQISLLCLIYQEVNIWTNIIETLNKLEKYISFSDDTIRKSCLKSGNKSSTTIVDSGKHVRIDIRNEHTMI